MPVASVEDDIAHIARKFEKMVDGSRPMDGALELLDRLAKLPVTIEILTVRVVGSVRGVQKTRIGMTLNDLRKKTTDEKLAKRAKTLIKEWKSLLDNKPSRGSPASLPRIDSSSSNLSAAGDASRSQPSSRESSQKESTSTSFPPKHLMGDDLRIKSTQMLMNALRYSELPLGTLDPEEIAVKIEAALFDAHRGTGDKYKAALRSRVFNLRDKKNPALRENVLTGVIRPEKFAIMTADEMASDEIKQQREKFTKEAINEHQMGVQEGTPSDMFKCGKCGKKNCTYTQLQTRSSDEPMTTFVFCRECGNRWKFC